MIHPYVISLNKKLWEQQSFQGSYSRSILLKAQNFFFFFYQGFLSRTLTTHRAAGEGRGPSLFHSTTSTRSRTFRHLFATLHVRWLSHIFNCNACIYQAATRWHLPPYRITIWLTDDVILIFVCLHVELNFVIQKIKRDWNEFSYSAYSRLFK